MPPTGLRPFLSLFYVYVLQCQGGIRSYVFSRSMTKPHARAIGRRPHLTRITLLSLVAGYFLVLQR